MTFHLEYDLSRLHPAPYNPRQIDEASLERLRESLNTLGLIKPVIATADGTLLAGHQRTRTMQSLGYTHCPAFVLAQVTTQDEIRFNQLHNASDLDLGEAILRVPAQSQVGYVDIAPQDITGSLIAKNASRRGEILRMLTKHGAWGSIIVTQSGEVLVSKLYAMASKILNMPCKAYVVPDTQKDEVLRFFGQQYGRFSYAHLPKTTWGQSLAQMMRLRNEESGKGHSKAYEGLVIPRLKKEMRILDFGAGQMDYVKKLKKLGYNIRGIEFYFRKGSLLDVGQVHRDIDALCQDISQHGRYDMVICDSVLNSVDSLQAEQDVLTCLSALCKLQGMIIFSGRSREAIEYGASKTTSQTDHRRYVQFLDDDGFSSMFSNGVWRYQKFHTFQDVERLASFYCGSSFSHYVTGSAVSDVPKITHWAHKDNGWGVVATKQKELPLEQRHASLSREFDLPLPQGKRYGRSADILAAYDAALALEQGDTCTSA